MDYRTRPHVSIPAGARPPQNPSYPSQPPPMYSWDPVAQDDFLPNPWDDATPTPTDSYSQSQSLRPGPSIHVRPASRPPSRATTASAAVPDSAPPMLSFPEPHIQRSTSATASVSRLGHRPSRSDVGPDGGRLQHSESMVSLASMNSTHSNQYYDVDEMSIGDDFHIPEDDVSSQFSELSELTLQSEEGLEKFQRGELKEADEEWYRLVPKEALEALPKNEVKRQSVLFELIKSERDYVHDLETIMDVYVVPLANANPPIIPPNAVNAFIDEVFCNVRLLLSSHQRILAALLNRQRETHPLVTSFSDLILDMIVREDFRKQYEEYVKHYPLAESRHRNEMRRNERYRAFVQGQSSNPRVKKRDLATFLSRPVTRLPRLNLMLETILKETDKENDHPDLETLPLIIGILADVVKSTQPGIAAAEGKVKFWELCESLVYRKGEIIDLDLYNPRRTLVYTGDVVRKAKSDYSSSGASLALLDHCVLILKEEKRPNGVMKRQVISRPIPLAYLNLGSFTAPSELKRDPNEEVSAATILLSRRNISMYPFTIYHGFNSLERRYNLYVLSEALRKKWHDHLTNALTLFAAHAEANMFFEPVSITDDYFRFPTQHTQTVPGVERTGRITSAVPFTSRERRFVAIGTPAGIFVAPRNTERFRRVFTYSNPTAIIAVQSLGNRYFNKFIVLHDNTLTAYSLDLVGRVAVREADPKALHASQEKISGPDTTVLFAKQVIVGQRMLLIYASRRFLSSSLHLHALEVMDSADVAVRPNGRHAPQSFRQLGEPGYVPKDATDISVLLKTIGVSTPDGVLILDPTDLANSKTALVPDWRDSSNNVPMSALKHRIENVEKAQPLGLIRVNAEELLLVYDKIGVYITRHGSPTRNSGFAKWEITATAYAHVKESLLLVCQSFVEIRNVQTSILQQVVDGRDFRLLWAPSSPHMMDEPVLIAQRGTKDDRTAGMSDKLVELVETHEISATTGRRNDMPVFEPQSAGVQSPSAVPALWAEWDM